MQEARANEQRLSQQLKDATAQHDQRNDAKFERITRQLTLERQQFQSERQALVATIGEKWSIACWCFVFDVSFSRTLCADAEKSRAQAISDEFNKRREVLEANFKDVSLLQADRNLLSTQVQELRVANETLKEEKRVLQQVCVFLQLCVH